jgi:hypothetical protein
LLGEATGSFQHQLHHKFGTTRRTDLPAQRHHREPGRPHLDVWPEWNRDCNEHIPLRLLTDQSAQIRP